MREETFYMVWSETTHETHVRHSLEQDAVREAERLAEANPGIRFFVLQATGYARTAKPVTWTQLDAIPF